jgi:Transposase zinc-binding domain
LDCNGQAYRHREPEHTVLHEVGREELEPFLTRARQRDHPVPGFVERELRAYLDCGILARGFVRVRCDGCGLDRVVGFACKGRAFCPSCGGRRMAEVATRLVDQILPTVPVRQWVVSLPFGLRYRMAFDAALTTEVLRVFIRAVFASLRRRARRQGACGRLQCGAVTWTCPRPGRHLS